MIYHRPYFFKYYYCELIHGCVEEVDIFIVYRYGNNSF